MRFTRNWRWILAAVLLTAAMRTTLFSLSTRPTAVLGGTVAITEVSTGVEYTARVDTGAAVSSIHVEPEDVVIEDESSKPTENVAKKIHLRLDNGDGKEAWVEARVEDYVEVRSANGAEHRYQVRLPLQCGEVQKVAILNLKDRSDMTYRLLLGRDFLRDDFVVDVAHEGPQPLKL